MVTSYDCFPRTIAKNHMVALREWILGPLIKQNARLAKTFRIGVLSRNCLIGKSYRIPVQVLKNKTKKSQMSDISI